MTLPAISVTSYGAAMPNRAGADGGGTSTDGGGVGVDGGGANGDQPPAGGTGNASGCGCRVSGERDARPAWILAASGIAALGARRRRRTRSR